MSEIPHEMQEHLAVIPAGLQSLFLPQLLQLGANTFSVPYGIAARLDGVLATGWFWACALDDDCLITTMHMVARRTFVLREQPEIDYLVLGLLSSSDTELINDMRMALGSPSDPSDPFSGGFSPTLERSAIAFPMTHGLREFEIPAGSLHDSCNVCMLPSFVERLEQTLGPDAPDLVAAFSEGLELNGSTRIHSIMRAIDPMGASRAGAALHYRSLVYDALAETASYLREQESGEDRMSLHEQRRIAEAVNTALIASLANPPSLDELADRLFMGKTRLCQAYRAETGMSIGQRLTELRVREAKRHLEHGQESMAEIARALGFSHTSSFSAMFARETGMSPTAWRTTHSQR